jgi:hypothetical protein
MTGGGGWPAGLQIVISQFHKKRSIRLAGHKKWKILGSYGKLLTSFENCVWSG